MSPDEAVLRRILIELNKVHLEAILVGNAACALQGVPVMTQDIDFFVRDTALNKKKISLLAKSLKLNTYIPNGATTEVIRLEGSELVIDFVFRLSSKQRFESVRSRAIKTEIGNLPCLVASLEDILKSKKAANREKDKLAIKLIQDTMKVKKILK